MNTKLTFEIYRSGILRKSWKWKAKARNGEIMASGRGFNNKYLAKESVDTLIKYIQAKDINVLTRKKVK